MTRQQTLSATLQWSHQLLDPEERLLFRRLAAFAGGFSLAAVEEVCTRDIDPKAVLDLLGRLVDKSLVLVERRGDETSYRLLETIRQYARERLRDSGERAQTETMHREFYLALAESHEPERTARISGDRGTSLPLEADHDNLRAALRSALASDPDTALRLAVALQRFWVERGYLAEGRRRLDDALARASAPTPCVPGLSSGRVCSRYGSETAPSWPPQAQRSWRSTGRDRTEQRWRTPATSRRSCCGCAAPGTRHRRHSTRHARSPTANRRFSPPPRTSVGSGPSAAARKGGPGRLRDMPAAARRPGRRGPAVLPGHDTRVHA